MADEQPTSPNTDPFARLSWGEVVWTTPASLSLWEELSRLQQGEAQSSVPQQAEEEEQQHERLVLGPVLGDRFDPRIALLSVFRDVENADGRLRWSLQIFPTPEGQPPEEFQKISEHLGGRRGLMEVISRATGSGGAPVASHELQLTLAEDQWESKVLPRRVNPVMVDASIFELCRAATIEHIGYRLTDGVSGIDEISFTYLHEERAHHVTVLARGALKFAPDNWLPFADDVMSLIVGRFFIRKEVAP